MSTKQQTLKYGIASAIVAVAIIAGATLATAMLSSPQGSGALNFYLTDAPPQTQNLKSLLVNVSSITLSYEGSLTTSTVTSTSSTSTSSSNEQGSTYVYQVPTSTGTNVDLLKLQGQSLLLGATKAPVGTITRIVISITGAKAYYTDGTSEQLKLAADGKLMVPIQFNVLKDGSTDLTIDIMPNMVHISQGNVLTPIIHVTSVEKELGTTTIHTTEVDVSTTATTTTSQGP